MSTDASGHSRNRRPGLFDKSVFIFFPLQESAPALTNKAGKAYYLSWMCINLDWLEGKSVRRDELSPASQGSWCIFHCNIQGTKNQ